MYSLLAVSKAISDETRLRIINVLLLREFCVCELQEIFGMSEPRISRHLRILKASGLVSQKREGKWNYYRLRITDSNRALFDYLNKEFKTNTIFLEDTEKAKNTNLSCSL